MIDSSHNERGPPKESFSHQSSLHRHMDASSPPPMPPPHNLHYPPQGMGYPGPQHPPAHHGYPPAYGPYPNQYAQPHGYYPAPPPCYNVPPAYHNGNNGGKAFIRGFILCSCIIFTCLFVVTLVMALVLHPQLPVYTVNSLSVANFNTTPTLIADWNTSITVENKNKGLKGLFSDFKVDLICKNNIVAMSYVPNFELDKTENKQMDTKPSSNGLLFTKEVLDEIVNERADGSITLSMRIASMVSFRANSISTRNTLILALCDDLKVVFQNNTGIGALEHRGVPISCQIYT